MCWMWNRSENPNTILDECKQPWQSYRLFLRLRQPVSLSIPTTTAHLPAGWYVYIGSAKRRWVFRLQRHCRREKSVHWHIDQLTTHPAVEVRAYMLSREPECELVRRTNGIILIPGFGASDCRKRCGAHLRYLPDAE